MDTLEINMRMKSARINNALGFFIFVFGIIVIIAMLFTETFVQQMTDLVAGLTLVLIGGGMMWTAKRKIKKLKSKQV